MKYLIVISLLFLNIIHSQNNENKLKSAVNLYISGEFNKSISELNELEKIDTINLNKILYFKGLNFLELKKNTEALMIFDKNNLLYPNSIISHLGKGQYYLKSEEFDKAIYEFTKAIEIDYNYELAHYYRAESYFNKFDYKNAVTDYTNAISFNSEDADYYLNRAICYYYLEEIEKSCKDYKYALKLDPSISEKLNLKICD